MSDFDAIVIGSGISGGWAAKELTEKGLKVLMIERGRSISPEDYVGEHKAPWDFPFRGFGDRATMARDQPIQRSVIQCEEGSTQFFVNDRDHVYDSDAEASFHWIRGYHLGGRSLTWGRATPRWGAINFEDNQRDGHAPDWPIRYDDIRPWYDHVERFAGVSGQTEENFETCPVGSYLPPFALNCVEKHVADAVKERFGDRRIIPAPTAVLSQDHGGRAKCHFCGPCHRGCSTGSYFSTISSTLPAALATKRLTVMTDTIVAGLDFDPATRRISGVRVIDAATGAGRTLRARIVFLNASTLGTTQILLQSTSEAFPNGLANSSGVLGHYLMDHVMGPRATGVFDLFPDMVSPGNRPTGIYVPRFRNVGKQDAPFLRGYGFQGSAIRQDWTRGPDLPLFGKALKQALRRPGPWTMFIAGMGECLPYHHNRVALHPTRRDKWGLPILNVHFEWGENEMAMARDMADQAEAMLKAGGAVHVTRSEEMLPGGQTVHEMGTARMGRDPATSVLNGFNQAHDVANLFITDGACMASSAAQNPSITYMALTARAADHAVGRMKEGSL